MRYLEILTEAKHHVDMFREMRQVFPDVSVDYEMNALKPLRSDMQVWIARYARIEILDQIIETYEGEQKERAQKLRDKYATGLDLSGYRGSGTFDNLLKNLKHFEGIPSTKIKNYRFTKQSPNQAMRELSTLERAFADDTKGTVKADHDGVIVARSGSRYWVLLPRGYCPAEASAMGHCGNSSGNVGDCIISLRGRSSKVDSLDDVFLTFILNKDGKLGEMKGRANAKPSPRYHRDIVALLKSPVVKGIKGGGWLAANNFSVYDLSDELYAEIADLPHIHGGGNGHKYRMAVANNDPRLPALIEKLLKQVEEELQTDAEDRGDHVYVSWSDVFHFLSRADSDNYHKYDVDGDYFVESYVVRDFIEENKDIAEVIVDKLGVEEDELVDEAENPDSEVYGLVSSAIADSGYREAAKSDILGRIHGIGIHGARLIWDRTDVNSTVEAFIPYSAIAAGIVEYDSPNVSEAYHTIGFDEDEAKALILKDD